MKTDIKEMGCEVWTGFIWLKALVNMVMNVHFGLLDVTPFWTCRQIPTCLRKILPPSSGLYLQINNAL
jgi:hypothetical protein